MEDNKFIFGIVIMTVIVIFLFFGVLTWIWSENKKDFAAKCSEFGGASIYNGQHWECLGVKNGNQ